jgi:hypothetical protein
MKRTDINKYILILVLRTAGFSISDCSGKVACHINRIGEAEQWFKALFPDSAATMVNDESIKSIVEREIDRLSLKEEEKQRVLKITPNDIFRRYNKHLPGKLEHTYKDQVYAQHQDALLKAAQTIKNHMSIPCPGNLFVTDTCRQVSSYAEMIYPFRMGLGDGSGYSPVFTIDRISGIYTIKELNLGMESEDMYLGLAEHLSEIDWKPRIEKYKTQLKNLIQASMNLMKEVSDYFYKTTGSQYVVDEDKAGIYFALPVYLCRYTVMPEEMRVVCDLTTEPSKNGLWMLKDKMEHGVTLASGNKSDCVRYQKILEAALQHYSTECKSCQSIRQSIARSSRNATKLTADLKGLIDRNYFKGRCSLCKEYSLE